ncbi:MAG: UDP-N-acetylmuramate dehydrogenase [Chloroflexi bacterium]|nr:UDP-N-acetylmuramate dehydrogenase [Chloroflexota bacterium]
MARHTSFHIGGPAEFYLRVDTIAILEQAVSAAWAEGLPCTIFSGGSNMLVADAGIKGLVIENRCKAYRIETPKGDAVNGDTSSAVLVVESGASLAALAGELARAGWSGLEWATGIPGSVGGAVIQNAGAWGQTIADVLLEIELLEKDAGSNKSRTRRWEARQLRQGYRTSALREMPASTRPIVLRAWLQLQRGNPAELKRRLAAYVQKRTLNQPRQPSAGSVFRNPPGDHAGRLIEAVGLKGHRIGDAQISVQHANFIVNLGEASAQDVWSLVKLAQKAVQDRFDVLLVPEIERIGAWDTRARTRSSTSQRS